MEFITDPREIERRSMEIIAPHLAAYDLDEETTKVYSRLIHAAGDTDYAPHIKIHPAAIKTAKDAICNGAHIYTDVEMVRTGINKRKLKSFGGEVHTLIAEENVAALAKKRGITRAMAAMQSFGSELNGAIVAIGNAPTALFEVLRLAKEENIVPAVILGIPVGFVGAAESKAALIDYGQIPYITVTGPKGGSPIAAAAVNAILYILNDER